MSASDYRKSGARAGWGGAVVNCWLIAAEASVVLPLRVARIARGGEKSSNEVRLMVDEKVAAQIALAEGLASGRFGKRSSDVACAVTAHYLGYVRANRRRLTR